MAKQIITTCDVCMENDVHTEAETTPPMDLLGTRAKPRTLDLCEAHHRELVLPLLEALNRYGATVAPPQVGRPPKGSARPAQAAPTAPHETEEEPALGGNTTRTMRRTILGPFECQVAGCKQAHPSVNLDAFAQHTKVRHGITLSQYRTEYGQPGPGRPDIPEQADLLAGVYRCSECDEVFTPEDTAMPAQALGRHQRRDHGIKGAFPKSA